MQVIGTVVIYIVMICMMAGCIGAVINPTKGIGFEFCEGLRQLSTIFVPIAGVMSALPYLGVIIRAVFAGLSEFMGNDLSMWAGIILPPDMGGNILINSMAFSNEIWIIALFTSFILGSGVTFGIPMSISMVQKKDHTYMAMGMLCGLMACPIGITVSCILCMLTKPAIREMVSTTAESTGMLNLTIGQISANLCFGQAVVHICECFDVVIFTNAGSYAAVLSPIQFSSQEPPKELFLSKNSTII